MYKEVNGAYPIVDREMYDYYRQHRRGVAKGLNQFMLWEKAIGGLMTVMKNTLVEKEEGIYIKGFGYFYYAPSAYRRKRISILKRIMKQSFRVRCILEDERLKDKFIFNTGALQFMPEEGKEYKENLEYIKYKENLNKEWKK